MYIHFYASYVHLTFPLWIHLPVYYILRFIIKQINRKPVSTAINISTFCSDSVLLTITYKSLHTFFCYCFCVYMYACIQTWKGVILCNVTAYVISETIITINVKRAHSTTLHVSTPYKQLREARMDHVSFVDVQIYYGM